MRNTNTSWQKWGELEPYYAVLSQNRFRKENLSAENIDEFFLSGEAHIDSIFDFIKTHINPSFSPRKALDFGCGTGRIVIPLAQRCQEVVGVDISPAMLAETQKNCESRSITNVKLVPSDDTLSQLGNDYYDLVHSYIVLQHIPKKRGEKIIDQLISHLAPEGIATLHIIFHQKDVTKNLMNEFRKRTPFVNLLFRVLQRRNLSEPLMEMNEYNLNRLFASSYTKGVKNIFCSNFTDYGGRCHVILYIQKELPH
jgi:ubiquinone/menaquinone biosynthesis C-methylase UbiE